MIAESDDLFGGQQSYYTFYDGDVSWCPGEYPGHSFFSFVSNGSSKNMDIYIGDVTSPNQYLRLTTEIGTENSPKWSPDGKRLIILSSSSSSSSLYEAENIIDTLLYFFTRTISSAGRTVVYETKNNLRKLTDRTDRESNPSWSPDGKWIIYETQSLQSNEQGAQGLRCLNSQTGEGFTIVSDEETAATRPAISADNRYVAFFQTQNGQSKKLDLIIAKLKWPDSQEEAPRVSETRLVDENVFSTPNGPRWGKNNKLFYLKNSGNAIMLHSVSEIDWNVQSFTERLQYSYEGEKLPLNVSSVSEVYGENVLVSAQWGKQFNIYSLEKQSTVDTVYVNALSSLPVPIHREEQRLSILLSIASSNLILKRKGWFNTTAPMTSWSFAIRYLVPQYGDIYGEMVSIPVVKKNILKQLQIYSFGLTTIPLSIAFDVRTSLALGVSLPNRGTDFAKASGFGVTSTIEFIYPVHPTSTVHWGTVLYWLEGKINDSIRDSSTNHIVRTYIGVSYDGLMTFIN